MGKHREWITIREVSRDFGLSLNTVTELARNGTLPAKVTEDGEVLVSHQGVYAYCKRRGLMVPDDA